MATLAAFALALAALAVVHVRAGQPAPVQAVSNRVPAWLPALRAPMPAPAPLPLAVDWLAQHPAPAIDVHAGGAVLLDLDTREVMWARDPHQPRPPASLTKLVTAMVAVDLATSLDQAVTVPAEAAEVQFDWTVMGLSAGEVVTVRDLLYGMFLVSGNDAAEALARVFTSRDRFVQLMNAKAAALGMRDSRFSNPTGLDDPGLRSSAYDLAVAAETVATRYPALVAIAGARDADLAATDTHKAFFLHTLIRLLTAYPGATGLKTGYTDDAGYCLVGTAVRGDRHLAVVLLGSDLALTADAEHLLDYGFAEPRAVPFDPSVFPQV